MSRRGDATVPIRDVDGDHEEATANRVERISMDSVLN